MYTAVYIIASFMSVYVIKSIRLMQYSQVMQETTKIANIHVTPTP